jgi:hypothetical protein
MGVVQGASFRYDANLDKMVSPSVLSRVSKAIFDSIGVEYDYLPSATPP